MQKLARSLRGTEQFGVALVRKGYSSADKMGNIYDKGSSASRNGANDNYQLNREALLRKLLSSSSAWESTQFMHDIATGNSTLLVGTTSTNFDEIWGRAQYAMKHTRGNSMRIVRLPTTTVTPRGCIQFVLSFRPST